jgi:hypothetical protein
MDNSSQQPIEQKSLKPSVPLTGFGQLIDQTWAIYKGKFITYILIALIPGLISYLLSFIPLAWTFEENTNPFSLTNSLQTVSKSSVGYSMAVSILISLISFLASTIGYAALIYLVKDRQEKINIKEAFIRALKKTPQIIWVSILVGLIIFGGFGLFIIPGVYFATALAFAIFIVVVEDKKGMEAVLLSKFYIKDNWFQVFWRFFFLGILYLVVIILPLGIATWSHLINFSGLFSLIFNTFCTPFLIIFTFLLYQNLKEKKQGVNLDEAKKSKNLLVFFAILGLLFTLIYFLIAFLTSWFVPKI